MTTSPDIAGLVERLTKLATQPVYAPPATFANACGEAAQALAALGEERDKLRDAIELQSAILADTVDNRARIIRNRDHWKAKANAAESELSRIHAETKEACAVLAESFEINTEDPNYHWQDGFNTASTEIAAAIRSSDTGAGK